MLIVPLYCFDLFSPSISILLVPLQKNSPCSKVTSIFYVLIATKITSENVAVVETHSIPTASVPMFSFHINSLKGVHLQFAIFTEQMSPKRKLTAQ